MKRILHISKYYSPFRGGTEQIVQECVETLANAYEQKVICFNHEPKERRDCIYGIEVIRCACFAKISSQSLSLSYSRVLKEVLANFKPDIIIFHYPNPFVAHYLLRYIHKATKLVVYWHLDIVKQKLLGKLFIGQNNMLISRADLIIATSPKYVEGSTYLSTVPNKCRVIPNCINVERLQLTEEATDIAKEIRQKYSGKTICVAVGRHTEYKGFKYLIQASGELDNRFVIFMIGEGELTDELKKQASPDKKIHFLGKVSDDELKAYFLAMDIFCFPSITKNEAFGLALAESMYFGKPAITFTIPGSGVNYVCLNGEDGIEVPNRDVKAYAEAMIKLADEPALRTTYGENGKQRVINNFLDTQFKQNIHKTIDAL